LEARLQFNRNQADVKKEPQKEEPKVKTGTKLTPEEKKKADQKKVAQYKKDVASLRLNVTIGNWDKVKEALADLPDQDAQTAFSTIATQLGQTVSVSPRAELSSLGAPSHKQAQYLRPMEILQFSDVAKKTPDDNSLKSLARLIDSNNRPSIAF